MLYDVYFNGHIVVDGDSLQDAINKAASIMDKSGAWVEIEDGEEY